MIGPQEDIPAPDMATDEQTMAWMMDTYSMQVGHATPEIVTGKPISVGGSVFRHEATGAGVVMVIDRACRRLGMRARRAALHRPGLRQGRRQSRRTELVERGAIVTGVADYSGAVHSENGLDLAGARTAWAAEHGVASATSLTSTTSRTRQLLELPCDVLVLAALEGQVTEANAGRLQAKMIAEGANGPTTVEADAILGRARHPRAAGHPHERRAASRSRTSSGSRTSAGCSGAATRSGSGSRRRCRTRSTASGTCPSSKGLTLRSAALVVGIREVAAALEARGLFP